MSIKNPITPAGIEPATFRFVSQQLNHCATAIPTQYLEVQYAYLRKTAYFCVFTSNKRFSLAKTQYNTDNRLGKILGNHAEVTVYSSSHTVSPQPFRIAHFFFLLRPLTLLLI